MDKNPNWSKKFIQVLQHCQDELKKTTEIGKKMISASKTNSELHELYEDSTDVLNEIRSGHDLPSNI